MIKPQDISTVRYKLAQGMFHSEELIGEGRMSLIYELIICCDIGKLSKDFTYYKMEYEGDMEYEIEFDEDDWIQVQPTMTITTTYKEVK